MLLVHSRVFLLFAGFPTWRYSLRILDTVVTFPSPDVGLRVEGVATMLLRTFNRLLRGPALQVGHAF